MFFREEKKLNIQGKKLIAKKKKRSDINSKLISKA